MSKGRCCRFRLVSVMTAVMFGLTNITWAQTPVTFSVDQKSAVGIILPADFNIPETLGSIQARFSENQPGKPFVIVVQDAHGILDAQNNVQKIIRHLQANYGVKLFALEGGSGKLDPVLFRTFPDEFVRQKIMRGYLAQGELTGSEMAAIFNEEEGDFYGIEDWNLYEDNYIAYLRAYQIKGKNLDLLLRQRNQLDETRARIYSSAMNQFHEKLSSFEKENSLLIEFVEYLASFEGVSERMAKYPEIGKLFRAFEFEKETAEDKAELESSIRQMAQAFKSRYLVKMNVKQEMNFHKHYQSFVTGEMPAADFLQFLVEEGHALGVKARLTPAMLRLLGHGETLAAIKGTRLFDELEGLIRETQETLITSSEERNLAARYRRINLLRDLVSLELTRNQWEEIIGIGQELESEFQPALEFYRLALERDQAFRRNLAELLKKHPAKIVAVLAGGFHSQGFEENLKDAGYSYIVITPNIRSLAGQETYADVMQGKNIPYKPYLKTTFYDAFAKDASMKLAGELNEPAFRKNIKAWRDNIIRRLSKEGRIGDAKDYTRYIDMVWKIYYDKFGKENFRPDARKEILKTIDSVLKEFQNDFINTLAQQIGGAPRALQTRAMMNLMNIDSPRLMEVILDSSRLNQAARDMAGLGLMTPQAVLRNLSELSEFTLAVTPEVENKIVNSPGFQSSLRTLKQVAETGQAVATEFRPRPETGELKSYLENQEIGVDAGQVSQVLAREIQTGMPAAERSELRASTDIRSTVNALFRAVYQNSSAGRILAGKFDRFSQILLKDRTAAAVQTRRNFVNFYNTLLASLRSGAVNRREFYAIWNQIFSFTPGHPSGNLDRILTGTQRVDQNRQPVYTMESFHNALALTFLDFGLKAPAGWNNPYQYGLNDQGEMRNQFGRLKTYYQDGLPAKEVLRILETVKTSARENRIQVFESQLSGVRPRREGRPTQVFDRKGQTVVQAPAPATVRLSAAPVTTQVVSRSGVTQAVPQASDTMAPSGTKTMTGLSPEMQDRYERLGIPIPQNAASEPPDSIFSEEVSDSLFESPLQYRMRIRMEIEEAARLAEAEKEFEMIAEEARKQTLERLNKPPAVPVKRKAVRSEIRAELTQELGALIWDELVHQNPQGYPEYESKNKQRFLTLLDRESVTKAKGVNIPRQLAPILQGIARPVVLSVNISNEREGKQLGIRSVHVLFDRNVPRGVWIYRWIMQQPVLIFTINQTESEESPSQKADEDKSLTAWILQQLEASDDRIEIYRHGYYQTADTEGPVILASGPLQDQVVQLFDRMAKKAEKEVPSVLIVEPGLSAGDFEAALAHAIRNVSDYEDDRIVIRRRTVSMGELGSVQSQTEGGQNEEQRILNNLFETLPPEPLAEEVENPFPRSILSVGPSEKGQSLKPVTVSKPVNEVLVTDKAARELIDLMAVFPMKAKRNTQKQFERLFTTDARILHDRDKKAGDWGEVGLHDIRIMGANGWRGYYLIYGNQIILLTFKPASRTHTQAGITEVKNSGEEEIAVRKTRLSKNLPFVAREERNASRELLGAQFGITIISDQAAQAFEAAAGQARQQTLKELEAAPKRPAGRRRSEVRSEAIGTSEAARKALEDRRRRRQAKRDNEALLKLVETGGDIQTTTQPSPGAGLSDINALERQQRSDVETILEAYRLMDTIEIPLMLQIARLEDAVRAEEKKLETPDLIDLRTRLESEKAALLTEQKIRMAGEKPSEEDLNREITIEKNISKTQSLIRRLKEGFTRPPQLVQLDEQLQEKQRALDQVRRQISQIEEGWRRLPETLKFADAAERSRQRTLRSLGLRSEVREGTEEVQEEILGQFDEGWLSREEQGLFSRIRDNREINEIYQRLSRKETVSPKELQLLMDALRDGNPLALILGRRLQGRDWVVNWQVSGVGEGGTDEGLGIKQLNTLLGAEGYNEFKRELEQIITDAMASVFGTQFIRTLYDDFKVNIRIVKPRSAALSELGPRQLRKLLDAVEKRIKQVATGLLQARLEGREKELQQYKIDLKTAVNLLAIKAGFDQVKTSSNEARLEAVIHSTFARELPGGIYEDEGYRNFIRDTIALRNALDQPGVLQPIFEQYTFQYKDRQGVLRFHTERVIREDAGIYLRKKIPWASLPTAIKEVFKTIPNYERAQAFFNRLSIQDYFIRWTLEFDRAQKEAEDALDSIQYLNKKVSAGESVSGTVADEVQMIADRYIMKDSKNRSLTSRLAFHGRAPPMEGKPVYVFMDIIGLGAEFGRVLTAQIGLIDQLIQRGDWEEVGNVQRNSGAPIIEKKIKMQNTIQETYEKVLGAEAETRPLLIDVGGDEVNLIFNAKGLPSDLLSILWFEMRRAVFDATNFQIRIGIESDVSSYRTHFEGLENAEIYAHMQALRTGDFVTELAKGIEEDIKASVLAGEFKNSIVLHSDGRYRVLVQSEAGMTEYSLAEFADLLAEDKQSKLEAAHEAAVEKLAEFSDAEIRQVADPVASRLTMAVLNAGAVGDDKVANWFLAEELLNVVAFGPITPPTRRYLARLIFEVITNKEEAFFVRKLAAVLIRIGGEAPTTARVTDFAAVISNAVQSTFKVRELFNFEEVEAGRKKYGENGRDLKDFLALGWQRNMPGMEQAAASNWNLAVRLLALRARPPVKISAQADSAAKRSEVREAILSPTAQAIRQFVLGSKRLMELFRGVSVDGIVQTVFASEFYGQTAGALAMSESPRTVLLVDTIRGAVIWKLAEIEGIVLPDIGRFETLPAGFKPLTPQALFLLDHPELLQIVLAKYNPSIDMKTRRARIYDGVFITRPDVDKKYIEEQIKKNSVAVAFQVGSEKEIEDILRVAGVIPLASRNNRPVDVSKLGLGFEEVRLILDLGTQIKTESKRSGLRETLYYDRSAAYLSEANRNLSRLGPLSDLALSLEEVKALMRSEARGFVMTPQAFSALASFVNELATRSEVRKAIEAAA